MGWAIVPEWLAYDPTVTPGEMRTYVALSAHAGGTSVVWPSIRALSAQTGRSQNAVRRDLEQLALRKAVEIVPWARSDGGQTSNRYKLLNLAHAPRAQPNRALSSPARKSKPGRFSIDTPPSHQWEAMKVIRRSQSLKVSRRDQNGAPKENSSSSWTGRPQDQRITMLARCDYGR